MTRHDDGATDLNSSTHRTPEAKPFRFKQTGHESHKGEEQTSRKTRYHRHHSSRHRSKRHKGSSHLADDPNQKPESIQGLDPDRAFRESLFDALADDEGADFWAGVYGEPIHQFPNRFVDEETGEAQQMDDEEYAQYVRRKMWERSREGIEAAREEKRQERIKLQQEEEKNRRSQPKPPCDSTAGESHNNFAFDFAIEASLRRGERRKDQRRGQELWRDYLRRWQDLQDLVTKNDREETEAKLCLRDRIPWPVASGQRKHVDAAEIEQFIRRGVETLRVVDSKPEVFLAALKLERVRWHPDKMHQRYGSLDIDEDTMKGVTATFQILDQMWSEAKQH